MSPHERVASFQGIGLFVGVSEADLARSGLRGRSRELLAGENLFLNGDERSEAWFVRAGWLRIRVHSPGGHESTIEILGPGEMCGAAGDFGRASYPYTVTALTDASVVGVPAAAFERWLASDAGAACRVARILSRRLLETAQLRAINAERAPLRLRLTLHWLSRKIGPRIPATRALLADLTGLRAETCSRVLSGLRRRGALRVSPGMVHVLRPEALSGVSGRL